MALPHPRWCPNSASPTKAYAIATESKSPPTASMLGAALIQRLWPANRSPAATRIGMGSCALPLEVKSEANEAITRALAGDGASSCKLLLSTLDASRCLLRGIELVRQYFRKLSDQRLRGYRYVFTRYETDSHLTFGHVAPTQGRIQRQVG